MKNILIMYYKKLCLLMIFKCRNLIALILKFFLQFVTLNYKMNPLTYASFNFNSLSEIHAIQNKQKFAFQVLCLPLKVDVKTLLSQTSLFLSPLFLIKKYQWLRHNGPLAARKMFSFLVKISCLSKKISYRPLGGKSYIYLGIYLWRMVVPSSKIVMNIFRTYEKLHCK